MNTRSFLLTGLLTLWAGQSLADSVIGSQKIVCSAIEAKVCDVGGECAGGSPLELKIPQFLIVDLKGKSLSTTQASGENRTTDIRNLTRTDGQIVLQGEQLGRAFSMVVHEESGLASIAIALDGQTIGVFGLCTPTPVK